MKLTILAILIGWNIPPLFRGRYSAVDLGGTVALLFNAGAEIQILAYRRADRFHADNTGDFFY